MRISEQAAAQLSADVSLMIAEYGSTIWLLEDDGETLQDKGIEKKDRPKGLVLDSSHPFYREFYGEAERIEKRPFLLLTGSDAWKKVDDDVRLKVLGYTYRTDGPVSTYAVERDDSDDSDDVGVIICFVTPMSRF